MTGHPSPLAYPADPQLPGRPITLAEALGIIKSQERTIEVLTERLAKREALIRFANGVNECAERREITAPPVRDADMAAFMGAITWPHPRPSIRARFWRMLERMR